MLITRRRFLRGTFAATLAATAGVTAAAYGTDTHQIDCPHIPISLGLNRPHRVVALGDIHFDPLFQEVYMERVSRTINALRPDLILYTGDFVTHDADFAPRLVPFLSRSQSRLGSFAVLGNHDTWTNPPVVTRALEKGGIRVLTNRSFKIPDEDEFYVSGLDSFWGGRPDPTILQRTPKHSRHILLVHEPDSFLQVDDPRIRLQISGHTHGGQVRVPWIGALILPIWGEHFDAGLFTQQKRQLYVNRGIGTLRPHLRFDCPPEITVFEIT